MESTTNKVKLLVIRAQAGDLAAFGRMVDRFRDMAYGYALSILGDSHLAEDAAQEAFVQVYRELASLRTPEAFPGWLKRIVFTCCGRMTRGKRLSTESLESIPEIESASPGPDELAERSEMKARVLAAIRALPETERVVTTLFYINGYSHHEIADFLEVSASTVKSRLHSSREHLKERMLKMVGDYLQKSALSEAFTRRILSNLPQGRCYSNSYGQGLAMLLNYADIQTDYDTIMGDSGLAFILHSEEGGPIIEGAVDVGWWPMVAWGVGMRLDFLGKTVGRKIRWVKGNDAECRADPKAHYWKYFDSEVKESITAGRLVLAEEDICFVVAGYDEGEPPLLGDWSLRNRNAAERIKQYPWGLIVLGKQIPRLDRLEADMDALHHAVALGQDRLEPIVPLCCREWDPVTARYTGQKSFALWAEILRETGHLGEAHWHANMVLHLGINRTSAVAYLRAMSERCPKRVATHLRAAADTYAQVLAQLETADTSQEAMMSEDGRETLAKLAARIASLEKQAGTELLQVVSD